MAYFLFICLVLQDFTAFLHLQHVSLSFKSIQISVSGVSFLQAGQFEFLLIVESTSMSEVGPESWEGILTGWFVPVFWWWSWILSLWRVVPCPVACFVLSEGLVWICLSAHVKSCTLVLLKDWLWNIWYRSFPAFGSGFFLGLRWRPLNDLVD